MTKRMPLDRLRDISKQRSIRRSHLSPSHFEPAHDEQTPMAEWPIAAQSREHR